MTEIPNGNFYFNEINLSLLIKLKPLYQHKKGHVKFDFSKKKIEISISNGVGSGVEDSLLLKSKRSGGVDFIPFFPKELELDFIPK